MKTLRHLSRVALAFLLLIPTVVAEPYLLQLRPESGQPSHVTFECHRSPYTLAINLPNEPYQLLFLEIQKALGLKLKRFTGWNPAGESHLTVVTPPEFEMTLSRHLSAEEIDTIACDLRIQEADIRPLGIGTGAVIHADGTPGQTFFLIADSAKAREVRHAIHMAYVNKGGEPSDWDPTWYFPHVTIGFTHSDIHEQQGLLKDIKHAWDHRFRLQPTSP